MGLSEVSRYFLSRDRGGNYLVAQPPILFHGFRAGVQTHMYALGYVRLAQDFPQWPANVAVRKDESITWFSIRVWTSQDLATGKVSLLTICFCFTALIW